MPLLKSPQPEKLLQYLSIPEELSLFDKLHVRLHLFVSPSCRKAVADTQHKLDSFFTPEPDITSSLIRVYSKLKTDETLVLSGWKLGQLSNRRKSLKRFAFAEGWLFRGGVGAVAGLALFLAFSQNQKPSLDLKPRPLPLAQIRFEDQNKVQVHYVRPELLHTIEFETTEYQ